MIQLLLPIVGQLLDKLLPDPAAAADAKLKMLDLAQRGELAQLDAESKLAVAQLEVNKTEAQGNWWQAGWRPLIGYVFGTALAWMYVIHPLLTWALAIWRPDLKAPVLVIDDHLWELMFGMLGLGGLRSLEKVKRAA